ncbi:hypothetical protein V1506DRAFT_542356 [Lipomyces tetrasporus]
MKFFYKPICLAYILENHHISAVSPAPLIVEGLLTPASANASSHAAVIIQSDFRSLLSSFSCCGIESSLGKPLSSQLRIGPIGSADPGRSPPRSQNEKSHSEIGDSIWEKSKSKYGGLTFNGQGKMVNALMTIPCGGPFPTYDALRRGMCT